MHQESKLINTIVPDLIKVMEQRFNILRNIAFSEPVGRRSLAQTLGISERALRTETDFLRRQDLIVTTRSGMILTVKGNETVTGLTNVMDQLLGLSQLEKELCETLEIKKCLIVSGDSDQQEFVKEAIGKLADDLLQEILPKGDNIIAVMGGTTMEQVAEQMTCDLALKRTLTFVPARGGLGEKVEIQANNISAKMALKTGGKHRALYVPEQVSKDTYRTLITEPGVQEVIQLIKESNAVVHSIGDAISMAERRYMPDEIIEKMREKNTVGEAFGYFFDENGQIIYRIPKIGLNLENLADMETVVAVAGGSAKAQAIVAYMKIAPKQTCLVTDEGAARAILKK
ncbi:sugar-binding transcriptional regulator [Ligilactobacillus ceti]|uniref:Central glycolytic regulator n=1 Tax=Ligilactobacillus ceti DSM 22408 TaxID=1122146 RepID=A0A0R2KQ02_9LACO|nr:sugar-binding domain-containing protein [Ligilactobacillus ceti]KRN88308.1 central glycolytic regulator [Ligilactobacillus ceti DSM 22408]